MRLRRTHPELVKFHRIVAEEMSQGYPQWKAEERAWDILHVERMAAEGRYDTIKG